MSRTASVAVMIGSAVVASAIFAVATLANPPAGTPGTTYGALAADGSGNIGIGTTTPATKLDVNGTTTMRQALDMTGNRILNIGAPATSTDAVSKAYADAPGKVWGEGRAGTVVLIGDGTQTFAAGTDPAAGECTIASIRMGRSLAQTGWEGSGAACPANWWVCSAAERGTSACGTVGLPFYDCLVDNDSANPTDGGFGRIGGAASSTYAWTADKHATTIYSTRRSTTGATMNSYTCDRYPVWCCKQL